MILKSYMMHILFYVTPLRDVGKPRNQTHSSFAAKLTSQQMGFKSLTQFRSGIANTWISAQCSRGKKKQFGFTNWNLELWIRNRRHWNLICGVAEDSLVVCVYVWICVCACTKYNFPSVFPWQLPLPLFPLLSLLTLCPSFHSYLKLHLFFFFSPTSPVWLYSLVLSLFPFLLLTLLSSSGNLYLSSGSSPAFVAVETSITTENKSRAIELPNSGWWLVLLELWSAAALIRPILFPLNYLKQCIAHNRYLGKTLKIVFH